MAPTDRAYALGPNQGLIPSYRGREAPVDLLVGGHESEGGYGLVRYRTTQQVHPHVHSLDDESVFVLAGAPTVTVGDEAFALSPGSFCYMPRGIPHAIASTAPWEGLSVSTPGGVFDSLLKDLNRIFEKTDDTAELGDRIGAALLKHGIRVLEGRWIGDLSIRQAEA